jgi:gluconolactonase
MHAAEVLVDGLDHPEGVAWDPATGVLWAGGEDGQLYRVDLDARTWSEAPRAPGFVLGLAVDGRSRLVICCQGTRSLCVLADGVVSTLHDGFTLPNYPAFAPDGTLYFSDSGRWGDADGRVFRLGTDGELEQFSDLLPHFPNGCAVTADGRHLWMVESRLDGTVPDGIAFTADGGVVVSCYRPDRIVHIAKDGRMEVIAEDPQGTWLSAPTNIVFVGAARDRLVSSNLGRWHLTLLDVDLRGAPLHYPERWGMDA